MANERGGTGPSERERNELQVHLNALHDLGPKYADDVSASLMKSIERMVDERVATRLAEHQSVQRRSASSEQTKTLAIALALGIPPAASRAWGACWWCGRRCW